MSQTLTSLNAVTSDSVGSVMAFNSLQTNYCMQYIATVPSGMLHLFFEASLDGVNFFSVADNVYSGDQSGMYISDMPALFIRARVTGLASGRTVTAILGVVG